MKTKVMAALLLAALATTGSQCINDNFLVAVNLPISACFAINPGSSLSFNGAQQVDLSQQIDPSYLDQVKSSRFYDIQISVKGDYNGSVAGIGYINNIQILTFNGTWASFKTPVSILNGAPKITTSPAGINELVRVLNLFATTPSPRRIIVNMSGAGTLSGQSPVPSGLSVCVEILAQADAEVK